jgi:amino acid transporter
VALVVASSTLVTYFSGFFKLGGALDLFGGSGIFTVGLSLAFWSFVGIEFACSLAEEVKNPKKFLPRGLIIGLFFIFGTSWQH